MSVKSNHINYRRHAATQPLAQRRAVHTDPFWTGAWQSVTPCPNYQMGNRSDYENPIEKDIGTQKECSFERARRNRSVCAGVILYTKRQMRKFSMPVCQRRAA